MACVFAQSLTTQAYEQRPIMGCFGGFQPGSHRVVGVELHGVAVVSFSAGVWGVANAVRKMPSLGNPRVATLT